MNSLKEVEEKQSLNKQQFVVFEISNEKYGIDIELSREIIKQVNITNVPNTEDYVCGVINLRGRIVPVVDLHKRFNIGSSSIHEDTRIIIVEIKKILIGLLVDKVDEIAWLKEDEIEPPPEVAGNIEQEFLKGVGRFAKDLLILIDLEKTLFIDDLK